MTGSFGIHSRPTSTNWEDVRKGPSLEAVREHLMRIANYRNHSMKNSSGPAR